MNMALLHKGSLDERGQALVEFSLVLSVLVVFFSVAIDFWRIYDSKVLLNNYMIDYAAAMQSVINPQDPYECKSAFNEQDNLTKPSSQLKDFEIEFSGVSSGGTGGFTPYKKETHHYYKTTYNLDFYSRYLEYCKEKGLDIDVCKAKFNKDDFMAGYMCYNMKLNASCKVDFVMPLTKVFFGGKNYIKISDEYILTTKANRLLRYEDVFTD